MKSGRRTKFASFDSTGDRSMITLWPLRRTSNGSPVSMTSSMSR